MNSIILIAVTSAACPPCAALHRDYEHDARFVWTDATDEVRERHGVRSVPTVIATRGGEEVGRHVGYEGRREMDRWISRMEKQHAVQNRALPATTASTAAADARNRALPDRGLASETDADRDP